MTPETILLFSAVLVLRMVDPFCDGYPDPFPDGFPDGQQSISFDAKLTRTDGNEALRVEPQAKGACLAPAGGDGIDSSQGCENGSCRLASRGQSDTPTCANGNCSASPRQFPLFSRLRKGRLRR